MMYDVKIVGTDEERAKAWQEIRNAMKTFQFAVSKAASVLLAAEMAGAKLEIDAKGNIRNVSDKGSNVLNVFGKPGAAYGYQLYEYAKTLIPAKPKGARKDAPSNPIENPYWRSEYHAALVKTVVDSWWKAKDPRTGGKATKGFMALQFDGRTPEYKRLPFPIKGPIYPGCEMDGHLLHMDWLQQEGRPAHRITFRLIGKNRKSGEGSMDARQWHIWRSCMKYVDEFKRLNTPVKTPQVKPEITADQFAPGSIYIHIMKRRGKDRIVLRLTYTRPWYEARKTDRSRVMEAAFSTIVDSFIACKLIAGEIARPGLPLDQVREELIDGTACLRILQRHEKMKAHIEEERQACGKGYERTRGEGSQRGYESTTRRLSCQTDHRNHFVKEWNWIFANKIVRAARRWDCGIIEVNGMPGVVDSESPQLDQGFLGHPWQWRDFTGKLENKARDFGIAVRFKEKHKAEEIQEALTV